MQTEIRPGWFNPRGMRKLGSNPARKLRTSALHRASLVLVRNLACSPRVCGAVGGVPKDGVRLYGDGDGLWSDSPSVVLGPDGGPGSVSRLDNPMAALKKLTPNPTERSGTVLLVEDEWLIRTEAADYVRDSGYQVLEVADAGEALAVLQSSETSIDLVVTDIRMPGEMDGRGLAAWVRENRPGTPIILASAYSTRGDEAVESVARLTKPYSGKTLVDTVQSALARRLT